MSDGWISQMRKGFVEFCILVAVRDGADYGYAIYKSLNETKVLTFTESTLYPALNRLTREGFLTSYKSSSSSGGPPRRHYVLSDDGKVRLGEIQAYWELLKKDIDELLVENK
ncbi:MAG: PadR family transcriptional regulator [Methyloligellaceae bacterium]